MRYRAQRQLRQMIFPLVTIVIRNATNNNDSSTQRPTASHVPHLNVCLGCVHAYCLLRSFFYTGTSLFWTTPYTPPCCEKHSFWQFPQKRKYSYVHFFKSIICSINCTNTPKSTLQSPVHTMYIQS